MARNYGEHLIGLDTETVMDQGVPMPFSWSVYSEDQYAVRGILHTGGYYSQDFMELASMLHTHSNRSFWFVTTNVEFDAIQAAKALQAVNSPLQLQMFYNGSIPLWAIIRDDNRHSWRLVDTLRLIPHHSVEKLGKMLGVSKLPSPEGLATDSYEDRQIRFSRGNYYRKFTDYAIRDAEISYRALKWLRDEVGTLRATLPSLTLALFKRSYGYRADGKTRTPDLWEAFYWDTPPHLRDIMQHSYKGGRVEAVGRGYFSGQIYNYDVRSLYPSQMVQKLYADPLSYCHGVGGSSGEEAEYRNPKVAGFAYATIFQEAYLPPLGATRKCSDGVKRLIFPNGTIRGYWSYPELAYLEKGGYGKVLEIHGGVQYDEVKPIFRDFVQELFERRMHFKKTGDSRETIYKLLMNSLYGKYGQGAKGGVVDVKPKLGNLKMVGLMKGVPREEFSPFTQHYALCAYVTAYGRIRLHELAMTFGGKDILYMDTDSLFTRRKDYPLGEGLGELSLNNPPDGDLFALFVRAKAYVLGDIVRWKGMSRKGSSMEVMNAIVEGKIETKLKRLLRPREAFKRDLPAFATDEGIKTFLVGEDHKRTYDHEVKGSGFISSPSLSQPLRLEEK